jgi:hypothetical protein
MTKARDKDRSTVWHLFLRIVCNGKWEP